MRLMKNTKNPQKSSNYGSYLYTYVIIFLLLILTPSISQFSLNSQINPQTYEFSNKRHQSELQTADSLKNFYPQTSPSINVNIDSITAATYSINEVFDGYNLILFERENRENSSDKIALLLVTDMKGNVIIQKEITKGNYLLADYSVELINSTTILMRIGSDLTLWNFDTDFSQTLFPLGGKHHHDIEYNPFTNTILALKKVYTDYPNGSKCRYDEIIEYNLKGESVWSLDLRTFIPPTHWCPYHDMIGNIADLTHANSIFWDVETDIIFLNLRNTNTFYKIDHRTSNVLWGLGEHGNFSLFDISGQKKANLFFHAHSIEKIDNNTFVLFDNDFHNQENRMSQESRLLEIKINEETMTANESWVWNAPKEYYCSYWGDADRLPNGNRLGTFGTKTHPNTKVGARAVEINHKGDIVWELYFMNNDEFTYGIYRMDRLRFSPIFTEADEITIPENATIQIQTWYNFRSKRKINGSYTIVLNNEEMESGSHIFEKFWRPTSLRFESDLLTKGNHNLTLILEDEGGHKTVGNINVIVGVKNTSDKVLIGIFYFCLGLFCVSMIYRIHRNNTRKDQ